MRAVKQPRTKGRPQFNQLRSVIRDAMNTTKSYEWDLDIEVSKAAVWQWCRLETIFQQLGHFVEEDR